MNAVKPKAAFAPAEACAIHRERIARRGADIDPNVRARIERGCAMPAADYVETLRERERLIRAHGRPARHARRAGDADLSDRRADYRRSGRSKDVLRAPQCCSIRNTAIGNFFDLCAHLTAAAVAAAGRADAGRPPRHRPHAVARRRGGGKGAGGLRRVLINRGWSPFGQCPPYRQKRTLDLGRSMFAKGRWC